MICHTMAAQVGAIELVAKAVKNGELSQKEIQQSVDRVKRLKENYLASPRSPIPTSTIKDMEARREAQSTLASEIYSKSTTLIRGAEGVFPISKDSATKIVFVSPGKTPLGGGAVDSGEEKTREPYTPATYLDIIKGHSPSATEIRFYDSKPLSAESQNLIDEADIVIYATRNASLYPDQKELGLSLGKKLGRKLITIATCDPYDFLEEISEIQNYITIYEPTIPAFKSAIDVIFGITKPVGRLPVSAEPTKYDIRQFNSSCELLFCKDKKGTPVLCIMSQILPHFQIIFISDN